MSRKIEVHKLDDFDGSPADTTIEFVLNGWSYTLDLTATHSDEFFEKMQPYIDAAFEKTKVPTATKASAPENGSRRLQADPNYPDKAERDKIRAWAQQHHYKVSQVGSLSAALINAFREATGGQRLLYNYRTVPLAKVNGAVVQHPTATPRKRK